MRQLAEFLGGDLVLAQQADLVANQRMGDGDDGHGVFLGVASSLATRSGPAPCPFSRSAVQSALARRWRSASNRHTPEATETLRLSTAPAIGMRTSTSQVLRVSARMPAPSAR